MKSLIISLSVIGSLCAMDKTEDTCGVGAYLEYAKTVNSKYPRMDAAHLDHFYTTRSHIAHELMVMELSHCCAHLDSVIDVFAQLQDDKSLRSVLLLKKELSSKVLMLRCFVWAQLVGSKDACAVKKKKKI